MAQGVLEDLQGQAPSTAGTGTVNAEDVYALQEAVAGTLVQQRKNVPSSHSPSCHARKPALLHD
jgi:hypothetical protein